jgi:phosphotransferase system enzyme I (PtsI)
VKFTGIAASPGIGVGPVFRFEREDLQVRDTAVAADRIEDEVRRFHEALDRSREDLTQIRDGIAHELGKDEAAIYEAHLMILDDPDLRQSVESGVRSQKKNAAWVFRNYMSGVVTQFDRMKNEYLKQRRDDLIDVARRVLRHMLGEGSRALPMLDRPSVLVAHDLGPSEVALLDRRRVLGVVTEVGGRTSHGAIVARGRGIPAVVSARGIMPEIQSGDLAAVDGYIGCVEIRPDPETARFYATRREALEQESSALEAMRTEPAATLDGRRVELSANIELPEDVDQVLEAGSDGIGLFRTEFFYLGRLELPGEEEQYQAYRQVAEKMAPRPVIFRTMDLGGDKVASYLGATHESNPFLGYRGIRLALHHPEMFRTQIRAIYRASAHGRVRMMFPMVTTLEEFRRARALCDEVRGELAQSGIPHDAALEIGLMIETPSAVWLSDHLAREAQFMSIGSNDLIQYTLAMDRDNERLAQLYEPLEPSVLRGIQHVIQSGQAAGRWVGICGEMAGDPRTAVLLVGLGIDELSMSCFDLPRVKAAIRSLKVEVAREIALEAVRLPSAAAVKELLRARVDSLLPSFLVAKRSPL